MAEQIPYGVAVSLINKLASLAFREFGRIYGVMDQLENLKSTLESIQLVLSDAEQKQHQDAVVEHWIRRFKDVLHEADDLLDALAIKDLRLKLNTDTKSKVRDFFSSENPLVFRRKLARKVENIRKNFNAVADDMSKLKLNPSVVLVKQNESVWRETGCFVSQSDIIGREESKKEIVDLLMQTHTNHDVSLIAIVGIGGLGKTALAQLVYNDAQVQDHFHKKIWVCVSEDFEVKPIIRKMLKSLKDGEVGDLELPILQEQLRKELTEQRYMLVLDDVWNESQLKWNTLKTNLMCGGKGSKILVTSRSKMVAQTMGIDIPNMLKGLTKEQSWDLLKKLAIGEDGRRMSPDLESAGQKIADKCGGVPLAIRTMGGLLQSRNEKSAWLNILQGDFWRLCEEENSILPALKLSYQNLPPRLRQCFAYCCLYPKDWEIQKNELIQLWMAQGYLESSTEMQSMEEVGDEYVKILLMRSFFQEASTNKYGDINKFKMHDLMRDLAKSVAGNDCYFDGEGKGIVGRPMHISLVSTSVCQFDSLDTSKLRTILWATANFERVGLANGSIIKNSEHLRVLDLSGSSVTQLPEYIGKLKHLRYLDLSYCRALISLPESIGNLVSLQTLKLYKCTKLAFPIEVITKLINLRYLDIEYCKAFEDIMPVGLGKLASLQFLPNFAVGGDQNMKSGKLSELKELNSIRDELIITNLDLVKDVASESQEANLKAKKYIQRLELRWGFDLKGNPNSDGLQLLDNLCPHQNLKELYVSGYPGVRFSNWLPSLTNIVEINLFDFSNCQHLPPLERLPWLKSLRISFMAELKYVYYEEISDVFFPSLEALEFSRCKNLRGWQRSGDGNNTNDVDNQLSLPPFPHLSFLVVESCPNLICMPTYPHLVWLLKLERSSLKPMIETCLVQLQSSSFYPLSGLKELDIGYVDIEEIPEEWMQNLSSLERLSLQGLSIMALPERISDLQSLRHIDIMDCPKLESLPEGMRSLTNLHTLRMNDCPLLLDRCQTQTGKDWPKIAHIPKIKTTRYF